MKKWSVFLLAVASLACIALSFDWWMPRQVVVSIALRSNRYFVSKLYYRTDKSEKFDDYLYARAEVQKGRSVCTYAIRADQVSTLRLELGKPADKVVIESADLGGGARQQPPEAVDEVLEEPGQSKDSPGWNTGAVG